MHCPNAFPAYASVPESKDARSIIEAALGSPTQRAELARALQRALNTWESPPSWLAQLSDALNTLDSDPCAIMTQMEARGKTLANLRLDVLGHCGRYLTAHSEVRIVFQRSFRIYPEGQAGSDLKHEYVVDCGGVFAQVTDEVLYNLRGGL